MPKYIVQPLCNNNNITTHITNAIMQFIATLRLIKINQRARPYILQN